MPAVKEVNVTLPPVVGIESVIGELPAEVFTISATQAEQSVDVGTVTVIVPFEKQVPFVLVTVKLVVLH